MFPIWPIHQAKNGFKIGIYSIFLCICISRFYLIVSYSGRFCIMFPWSFCSQKSSKNKLSTLHFPRRSSAPLKFWWYLSQQLCDVMLNDIRFFYSFISTESVATPLALQCYVILYCNIRTCNKGDYVEMDACLESRIRNNYLWNYNLEKRSVSSNLTTLSFVLTS